MNFLSLKDADIEFIKQRISVADVKKYVRDNGLFTQDEMFWVEFFWKIGIEMLNILLTDELLEKHFGYAGKRPTHDFVERKLRINFKEDANYIKVNRNNILVKEYLLSNPDCNSTVFYLLSPTCYSICLIQANTQESQAAQTYMVKMNFIAIRMINSVFMSTVEDLERLNINMSNNSEMISKRCQKEINSLKAANDKLQAVIDKLSNKNEAINDKLVEANNKPNKVSEKLEDLLSIISYSCLLCDKFFTRINAGDLKIEVEAPSKEIRLATRYYAGDAFRRLKSCICSKKDVPKEDLSIVRESARLCDLFLAKYTPQSLKIEIKSTLDVKWFKNGNYAQMAFQSLEKIANLYLLLDDD